METTKKYTVVTGWPSIITLENLLYLKNIILKWIPTIYSSLYLSSYCHSFTVKLTHSVVPDSQRPHESQHARPPCPSPSRSLLKLMPIKSVMPSSHLILCHPLLLLPPIPPRIRVFSSESTLRIRWSKYWSFSFSISPSNEHPGLIPFRMDWLDLLAVQGLSRVFSNTTVQKHQFFSAIQYNSVHVLWKSKSYEGKWY